MLQNRLRIKNSAGNLTCPIGQLKYGIVCTRKVECTGDMILVQRHNSVYIGYFCYLFRRVTP